MEGCSRTPVAGVREGWAARELAGAQASPGLLRRDCDAAGTAPPGLHRRGCTAWRVTPRHTGGMPPRERPRRPLAIDASHWRGDGRPKVRYPTRTDALVAAGERSKDAGTELGVYECAYCGGWHMSKRSGRGAGVGRRGVR